MNQAFIMARRAGGCSLLIENVVISSAVIFTRIGKLLLFHGERFHSSISKIPLNPSAVGMQDTNCVEI
jgi:hypothetical protein